MTFINDNSISTIHVMWLMITIAASV